MRYESEKRILLYDELKNVEWEEGKHVQLATLLYRHAIVVVCSTRGRQKAQFANGEFPYFAYTEIVNREGLWSGRGNNVIPVLPDGRLLMVVEQRPVLARYPGLPKTVKLEGGLTFDLGEFGSLEFGGGGIEPGENITLGILRELGEETGVPDQKVLLYRRIHPIFQFGSDVASANYYSVVFLSALRFEKFVLNDGGLRIVAMSEAEIEDNLRNGVISSGQAAIFGWNFYWEVKKAKGNKEFERRLVESGYLSLEEVELKK